jgi:hypothetical protein
LVIVDGRVEFSALIVIHPLESLLTGLGYQLTPFKPTPSSSS